MIKKWLTVGKPQTPDSQFVKETYDKLKSAIRELGTDFTMHELAMRTFGDTYQMLDGKDMSVKDRIVAAQNISDLMLGTYSPVALTEGKLEEERLRKEEEERLRKLEEENDEISKKAPNLQNQ